MISLHTGIVVQTRGERFVYGFFTFEVRIVARFPKSPAGEYMTVGAVGFIGTVHTDLPFKNIIVLTVAVSPVGGSFLGGNHSQRAWCTRRRSFRAVQIFRT